MTKLHRNGALLAVAAAALVLGVIVCAGFDILPHSAHAAAIDIGSALLANPVLLGLQARHAELTRAAEAKLAEVKDGLPADQVRTIETAHAELVRQAGEVQTQITAEQTRVAPPAPPPAPVLDAATRAAVDNAITAERQRVAGITAACGAHDLRDLAADMVTRGLTIDAARTEILAKLAERSQQNPRQRPQITITQDEGDTIRRAVESSIILRANPQALPGEPNREAREMARNWRGMSLMECGRAFVEETTGRKLRDLGRRELATVLLGLDTLGSRSAGMHSTSDFANILANVASKRLRDAYAIAEQNWKLLGRQSNSPDFKQKSVVQLSSGPAFKQVREGQEYSYGGLTDGVEKYSLATYGRIIAITRQALINDDLSAFDRLPTMLGRQAAELEASTFWAVLTANAAMNDSVALFHATHGNLAGSGTVIDEAGLKAAKLAMRKQKGLSDKTADAEPMNLVPKYLVVSPDKEVEAQKMLTAVLAAQTGNVNVFSNSLQLIVEARLTGNTWYVVADPALIDTIEYSYLEGEEGLFTEQRVGFEVDGIEIKGRVDFAAKAIDWRGMYKNAGA